jgi:hypothetical protein
MKHRYECALLRSLTDNVPVFPIFLAEMVASQPTPKYAEFSFPRAFPEQPHARQPFAQDMVTKLRYSTEH